MVILAVAWYPVSADQSGLLCGRKLYFAVISKGLH